MYKDIELYKTKHLTDESYGNTGYLYADTINDYLSHYKDIKTVLDFGCGKGTLKKALLSNNCEIDEYDPAIKGKEKIPKKVYDLIITTDVLEHLHNDELSWACQEFLDMSPKYMLHFISTVPAVQLLPDGTNAHKTIHNADWWHKTVMEKTNNKYIIYYRQRKQTAILNCIKNEERSHKIPDKKRKRNTWYRNISEFFFRR